MESRKKGWISVIKAACDRQIWPVFLTYEDCTWDNLSYCLGLTHVKAWYHVSHGGEGVGNNYIHTFKQRTYVEIKDGLLFSYLKKDLSPVPSNYENLRWWYENNHSVAELGLHNSSKLSFVQIDACYSAHYDDFARMLGMWSDYNIGLYPPGVQLYIGWDHTASGQDLVLRYGQWLEDFWYKLRWDETVQSAKTYAYRSGAAAHCDLNFRAFGAMIANKHFRYPE